MGVQDAGMPRTSNCFSRLYYSDTAQATGILRLWKVWSSLRAGALHFRGANRD